MKRVYLTGYKNQNLGDDLFFITVLKRYSNIQFLFEDVPTGYYSALFKDFNNIEVLPYIQEKIYSRLLRRICRLINRYWESQYYTAYQKKNRITADAYLKIGGSIFIEPNKDVEAVKKRFVAEKKYFGDIPFFYIGCNFGPYSSPLFYESAKYVIQHCNGICFRDFYSYNLFKEYRHARLAPDVLFGMKDICKCSIKRNKIIGLSLINLSLRPSLSKYYQSYLKGISSYIMLHCNEYDLIRLFSFCEPEGDSQAIRDLIALLPKDIHSKVDVVTYKGNYLFFLNKFSEVELLLSTRFHAMILGLVYGIKTIPIIYSDKISHVLNDIINDIPLLRLEKFNLNSLSEAVSRTRVLNVDYQINNYQRQFDDFDYFVNSLPETN